MFLFLEFMFYFFYVFGFGVNECYSIVGVGCGNYQGGGSSVDVNGVLGFY